MSTPPPPAPPLPPPLLNDNSPSKTTKDFDTSPPVNYPTDICQWAIGQPDMFEACARHNICPQRPPFRCMYKIFDPILQVGPTCGLVALSMAVNGEVTAEEMLDICKLEGYSCNGEMFSCHNMIKLMDKVFSLAERENLRYCIGVGGLYSNEIIEKLLDGAVLLVPYDADCNHSPCCRKGHTAHWALICGVIISEDPKTYTLADTNNVHVFARQGKSKHVALWNLANLDESNKNLWEISPKKENDGLLYSIPEGGIGGEYGLRDQYLLIEGL